MKKYIQDNLLLTKEAFQEHISKQRETEAKMFGLTLEEYLQAIREGKALTPIQSGSLSFGI
jgi:hypothetical protein